MILVRYLFYYIEHTYVLYDYSFLKCNLEETRKFCYFYYKLQDYFCLKSIRFVETRLAKYQNIQNENKHFVKHIIFSWKINNSSVF